VVERRFIHDHLIKFQDTQILSAVPCYMDRLIMEAIQLELLLINVKRDGLNEVGHGNFSFTSLEKVDSPLTSGD